MGVWEWESANESLEMGVWKPDSGNEAIYILRK